MSRSDATNLPTVITDATAISNNNSIVGICVAQRRRRASVDVNSIKIGETYGRSEDDVIVSKWADIVERYDEVRGRIIVASDFRLLAGYHWLAVAKKLGQTKVDVIIVGGPQ